MTNALVNIALFSDANDAVFLSMFSVGYGAVTFGGALFSDADDAVSLLHDGIRLSDAGSGVVPSGSLDISLDNITASSSGNIEIKASLSSSLHDISASIAIKFPEISISSSYDLEDVSVSISATVLNPTAVASLATALENVSVSVDTTLSPRAILSAVLEDISATIDAWIGANVLPCTVTVERVPVEYICLSRVATEFVCLEKTDDHSIGVQRSCEDLVLYPPPTGTGGDTGSDTSSDTSSLIPWFSCPQGIIPVSGNDFWFVTSDDATTTSTLYAMKYTALSSSWSQIFSSTLDVSEGDYMQRDEPDIGVAWNDTIRVIVTLRAFADYSYARGLDIQVFSGENLLNSTVINGGISQPWGRFFGGNFQSIFALIDAVGNIHIFVKSYIGTEYRVRVFTSSDNGATFSTVIIGSASLGNTPFRFCGLKSDGTIYLINETTIYSSSDNGATWSAGSSTVRAFSYVTMVNDTFLGMCNDQILDPGDVVLASSANGTTWSTVHIVGDELYDYWEGAAVTYDGTYYYAAAMFRDDLVQLSPGYTLVYRSADGAEWSLVATITDGANKAPNYKINSSWGQLSPAQLIVSGTTLYYFFYYSESESDVWANVYFMCVWKSVDQGVTWTVVNSPFYDLTRTGAVAPT
jgi:hypothetical protein